MNILYLSQRIPFPANKGEKIRTFNQIQFLQDQGHSISVFSPQESPDDVVFCTQLNDIAGINSELFEIRPKWLRLFTGLTNGKSLSEANFFSAKLKTRLEQEIVTGQYDAIVCTSSAMAAYLLNSKVLAACSNKPKLLVDFMDLDSDKWLQYAQSSNWPISWLYNREAKQVKTLELAAKELFDVTYLISNQEVELFERIAGNREKVEVLGNGLNTEEFYPAKNKTSTADSEPVFIFTGVMDYKPNVDAVVWFVNDCWKAIKADWPNAKFIIAGMNPSSEVETLGQDSSIEVTGFVDDILPYYHQADYFVAPFRIARGVQNKVLQAFACGLPVISTPMGAEGIDCTEGKDILLANSPSEFVAAINELQKTSSMKQQIAESALSLIHNNYSWQSKLKPMLKVLR